MERVVGELDLADSLLWRPQRIPSWHRIVGWLKEIETLRQKRTLLPANRLKCWVKIKFNG